MASRTDNLDNITPPPPAVGTGIKILPTVERKWPTNRNTKVDANRRTTAV